MRSKRIILIILSILLGIVSYYLFVGWYNIIPWVVAALLVGYVSTGQKDIIINGGLFGFFLFLSYIIIGYRGNTDITSLAKFSLLSFLLSLAGSIAGIVGTFIGHILRSKFKTSKHY